MPKRWKRLEAWAIDLRSNLFLKARIRLTLFYILILAVILAIFSQIILADFSRNIRRRAQRYEVGELSQSTTFIKDAEDQLSTTLFVVNAGILLITAGLSYFLAGRTLAPIRKVLDDQKQFLSDASHELRTPLAILKTNMQVELARKGNISKSHLENLQSNLDEVDRMSKLVGDLLLLSRLDNKQGISFEEIKLVEILKPVCNRIRKYAFGKRVEIKENFSGAAGLFVQADRGMLSSALANILKNAVDYSMQKSVVNVSAEATDGYVKIKIADKGVGIAADQLPHIFDRFYRVEKSRGGKVGGVGLGLAIAQAVVKDHGGLVTIESRVGKGTVVTVKLPVKSVS